MGMHDESISSPIAGVAAPAILRHFYTNKTWMEGETLRQLNDIAQLNGAITVAAFPDLHPGKYGPTGMALLAERLHPLLIGNDIGCGMSLFALDLPLRKLRLHKAEQRLRELEHQNLPDIAGKMAAYGLAPDLFSEDMGTIGGGNHFCELQAVNQLFSASSGNLFDEQTLYLLVHSGSRGLGAAAFSSFLAHNTAGHDGVEPNSPAFTDWKKAHDQCVVWASLNRKLIAERAAKTLHADLQLIADVPHNLARFTPEGIVHHKGAAVAHSGDLIPIAGSRASLSYVVRACDAVAQSLGAVSHGAGRKYDRASMQARMGKLPSQRDQLTRNAWGGRAICDDRALLVEESAAAYKNSTQVVADLEAHKLVEPVAAMRPLLTYKKARLQNNTESVKDKNRRKHYAKR